jgi:hypothetical protein
LRVLVRQYLELHDAFTVALHFYVIKVIEGLLSLKEAKRAYY